MFILTTKRTKRATPCRFAAVPLKGDKFGIPDEFIERLRINPPLGGQGA